MNKEYTLPPPPPSYEVFKICSTLIEYASPPLPLKPERNLPPPDRSKMDSSAVSTVLVPSERKIKCMTNFLDNPY